MVDPPHVHENLKKTSRQQDQALGVRRLSRSRGVDRLTVSGDAEGISGLAKGADH
jgi:hypothetical protein